MEFDSKHGFAPPTIFLGFSFALKVTQTPHNCCSNAYHLARASLPMDVGYQTNTSWTAQTKACVHQNPGERSSDPNKRLTQTCLLVSRSPWQRHGSAVASCRIGVTACSSACMGPFEGGCHYLHYLHHSMASSQITEREHSPTPQQNIGLKIY